jgi:hypothetical protein
MAVMDDAGVEQRLARLEADMARALTLLEAIAGGLEHALRPGGPASGTHLSRGLEKVAYTVTGAEQSLATEIRALDTKLAALLDDVGQLWANRDR